jgi:hypothetical protein
MNSRRHLGRLLICCVSFSLPAIAQLDSSTLRAKFGAPMNRETFHIPSGFDLVVDYGAGNQVCKLQVPALMPTNETVSNALVMKQRMYDFLAELVPAPIRGKELRRSASVMGTMSVSFVEYEHITISEFQRADQWSGDNTITVTFKNDACSK